MLHGDRKGLKTKRQMKIYSKITGQLLHIIQRGTFLANRVDIVPPEQYLQVAALNLPEGKTFKAHKHIENPRVVQRAQESWCVISGHIRALLYDLDDAILEEIDLYAGDISITLAGGHNYIAVEQSCVYEYKTPQYQGQEKDKVFIDEINGEK